METAGDNQYQQAYVKSALKMLGIEKLVVAIHDQSFPSDRNEETGRGSPYSYGGQRFTQFVKDLGFTGIQLGPQGKTSLGNPSPYDGTLFAKNELSVSLARLARDERWQELLSPPELTKLLAESPLAPELKDATESAARVAKNSAPQTSSPFERNYSSYKAAWHTEHAGIKLAQVRFSDSQYSDRFASLAADFANWQKSNEFWLVLDEKFEDDPKFFRFAQWLAHEQHKDYRRRTNAIGLKLLGDMQIGFSIEDIVSFKHLFLPDYQLGAPPSRTNPDGQPWGYPVLNPSLYFNEHGGHGPVLEWMTTRIDKFLIDYDGIRIDHPHGLICPWIYRSDTDNALRAVQTGARLFDSPAVPGHEVLAQFAIPRVEQLATMDETPRYAENWVRDLSDEQVDKYGVLIDLVMERVSNFGFDRSDIICEVLSSCPYPLKRVLQKNNLGRLRVTQKANPNDTTDSYRSDTARPEDWIMTGTHDTEPLWLAIDKWDRAKREDWAKYLAQRLEPDADARAAFAAGLVSDQIALIEAMFADLFVGPATNVSIFFADLLGMKQVYNAPGIVNETNWMLSVAPDFEQAYQANIATRRCLFLPRILAMALRAKMRGSQCAINLAGRLESTRAAKVPKAPNSNTPPENGA